MSKIERFEDLEVWQKARELASLIHELSIKSPLGKDYSLRDQINRSVGAIMDNIAEGFERGGNRELLQFLSIAKASSGETRSQLYRVLDKGYIAQNEFEKLSEKASEISKQISGFMSYLKTSEFKGEKYVREPDSNFES